MIFVKFAKNRQNQMKTSFYINYFYHLRLLFSSFSTKIQDATARKTIPVINPINKPNANILLTYLIS